CVGVQVVDIQPAQLGPSQAKSVGGLEHLGVSKCCQRALAAIPNGGFDAGGGVVEQCLEFVEGQGTSSRAAFVVCDVFCGVPRQTDLRGCCSELGLADFGPIVIGANQIVTEYLQDSLSLSDRGDCETLCTHVACVFVEI